MVEIGTVSLIVGTVAALGPLYLLLLDIRSSRKSLRSQLESVDEKIGSVRELAEENDEKLERLQVGLAQAQQRSESNQRHIHNTVLGVEDQDSDASDDGTPDGGVRPRECPYPETCPWHSRGGGDPPE